MSLTALSALAMGAIGVLATLFLMTRERRTMFRICLVLFCLSFTGGFSLYTYAYLASGNGLADALFAALRGIFSVGRMFSINDDRSLLSSYDQPESMWLFGSECAEIVFWLCHAVALVVVQTALISIFARRLNDNLRLRFGRHRKVYVIAGCNQNAVTLGENIATRDNLYDSTNTDRLIVFLIGQDDDAGNIFKKTAHFGAVLLVLDNRNDFLACLKKTGLGTWGRRDREYKLILLSSNIEMSDNIRDVVAYAKEKGIPRQNMEIFAITRSEWDMSGIENISKELEPCDKDSKTRKYPYMFHSTSDVNLITRQMISKYTPFDCLKNRGATFKNGETNRNFTVMVLGFGDIGQHALLRLAMNGQFVGSNMRAIVADSDMERLYDRFQHSYPAFDLCCEVKPYTVDVLSKVFYDSLREIDELLEKMGDSVDYIVAALGDDDDNKQVALDLKRHYLRATGDIPVIAILSREQATLPDNTKNMFCFGQRDEVYRKSVIIREEADLLAMTLSSGYDRDNITRSADGKIKWHELDLLSQESERAQVDFLPIMIELAAFTDEQITKLKQYKTDKKTLITDTVLAAIGIDKSLVETIARTEHLRWNAFHAAMGYAPMDLNEMRRRFERYAGTDKRPLLCRKDTTAKLHLCLTPWEKLDEYYAAYREINPDYRDFKMMDYDIFKHIRTYLIIQENGGLECLK